MEKDQLTRNLWRFTKTLRLCSVSECVQYKCKLQSFIFKKFDRIRRNISLYL